MQEASELSRLGQSLGNIKNNSRDDFSKHWNKKVGVVWAYDDNDVRVSIALHKKKSGSFQVIDNAMKEKHVLNPEDYQNKALC